MSSPENEKRTTEMSDRNTNTAEDQLTVEQWLQIRKEAGLAIDPETAEVMWVYAYTLDPYCVKPDLPEELQIGREYFARSPGSDTWIWFGDLPHEIQQELWRMHRHGVVLADDIPF